MPQATARLVTVARDGGDTATPTAAPPAIPGLGVGRIVHYVTRMLAAEDNAVRRRVPPPADGGGVTPDLPGE